MIATGGGGGLLVVVPAYNEGNNVGTVVDEILSTGLPVVVVDDGSSDNTASVARAHGAPVLHLPINLGVGGALRCGFRYAVEHGFTVVAQCDGDGQHIASEIQVLIGAMTEHGAHLVVGTRFASGRTDVGGGRRVAMALLSALASRRSGVALTDTTSGFRLIRAPLLDVFAEKYPSQYLGDTFEALLSAAASGYGVVEVPVRMRARLSGRSSASTLAAVKYILRTVLIVALGARVRIPRPSERAACQVAQVALPGRGEV